MLTYDIKIGSWTPDNGKFPCLKADIECGSHKVKILTGLGVTSKNIDDFMLQIGRDLKKQMGV